MTPPRSIGSGARPRPAPERGYADPKKTQAPRGFETFRFDS
jgi:hypothetical protein